MNNYFLDKRYIMWSDKKDIVLDQVLFLPIYVLHYLGIELDYPRYVCD